MSKTLMAYCGLSCRECPAYIAKRTDDKALRVKTANQWSGPGFSVSPEDVACDGCAAASGWFKFCADCEVRTCAASRGIATCAECDEYSCEKLEKLFTIVGPEARATLDGLRGT